MAKPLKAFVARSFAKDDQARLATLLDFLNTFAKLGLICESAEPAEAEQVSEKVQRQISLCDLFIGLFTRKYPIPRSRNWLSFTRTDMKWTAPSWVLQECGFALALKKKLILFVEPGVELPTLQGDYEYIVYDYQNPTEALKKTNEMFMTVIGKEFAVEVELTVHQDAQAPPPDITTTEEKKSEEPGIVPYIMDLFKAFDSHDETAAKAAFDAGLIYVKQQEGFPILRWESLYYQMKASNGFPEGFLQLQKLRADNPTSVEPLRSLAECQEEFGNYREAADLYGEAASIATSNGRDAFRLKSAASLVKANENERARELLLAVIQENSADERLEAFKKLYEVAKSTDAREEAFGVAEYSLYLNGAQSELHFNIAYDCNEGGFVELAALHYRAVLEQAGNNAGAANNLAIAYERLDLPIAAVRLYRRASELGNTLAAGNLGFTYLNAGMIDEAKQVISKAMEVADHDAKVPQCEAAINIRQHEEDERETIVREVGSKYRAFFQLYGENIISKPSVDIQGVWIFPWGSIRLEAKGDGISGSAEYQAPSSGFFGLAGPLGTVGAQVKKYSLSGKLNSGILQYELTIWTHRDSTPMKLETGKGTAVFKMNAQSALVLEKVDEKRELFEASRAP